MKLHVPPFFSKVLFVFAVLIAWEIIARLGVFSSLIFPSISSTASYMLHNPEKLMLATWRTLKLLLSGLCVSGVVALTLGALAVESRKVTGIVEVVISVLSPIPSISMLPFAILWFGLGENPIIFITVFGAFCPFLISIVNAFTTINKRWVEVGRNYGLEGFQLVRYIMFPASLPHLLAGFRSAWGIAWRSVVAAELVFGAVGGKGGLGWLIYMNRFQLNAAGMLAALICISLIGIVAENILEFIERKTVKKWGMKN